MILTKLTLRTRNFVFQSFTGIYKLGFLETKIKIIVHHAHTIMNIARGWASYLKSNSSRNSSKNTSEIISDIFNHILPRNTPGIFLDVFCDFSRFFCNNLSGYISRNRSLQYQIYPTGRQQYLKASFGKHL